LQKPHVHSAILINSRGTVACILQELLACPSDLYGVYREYFTREKKKSGKDAFDKVRYAPVVASHPSLAFLGAVADARTILYASWVVYDAPVQLQVHQLLCMLMATIETEQVPAAWLERWLGLEEGDLELGVMPLLGSLFYMRNDKVWGFHKVSSQAYLRIQGTVYGTAHVLHGAAHQGPSSDDIDGHMVP
jgi:hypothetical protein